MPGYAQQLYIEKGHSLLTKETPQPWPVLQSCVKLKLLPFADLALAQTVLKVQNESNEDLAALLCHLSLSARHGHLCISANDSLVDPDPRQLWLNELEASPDVPEEAARLLEKVYLLILEGARKNIENEFIKRHQHLFYLQKFWAYEELFLNSLNTILKDTPRLQIDEEFLRENIKRLTKEGILLPLQAKAVEVLGRHRLTILSGGPGTGKTYTAGHMIKLVWSCLDKEAKSKFGIAIAAPTGKAAANLQASLRKSTEDIGGFPLIKAITLHALLGIKSKKSFLNLNSKLSADLVLVDESSMIDVRMMAYLFAALKPGARLILLGDRYQLPSVEAGSLFASLIEFFEKMQLPSLIQLDQCVRTDKAELIQFAKAVKAGNLQMARQVLQSTGGSPSVTRLHFSEQDFKAQLLNNAKQHFPKNYEADPHALLQSFNRFRILTPLRKGPWGVEELNRFLAASLNSSVIPIMLMQNDSRLDLFNGETGVLVRDHQGDYALFPPRGPGEELRRFPAVILPKYEYAYCLSVHKSQGSEYEHVLMLVPKGSEIFGREVFYTAATRARSRLDVWGEDAVIDKTLVNRSYRLSGVSLKLGAFFEETLAT